MITLFLATLLTLQGDPKPLTAQTPIVVPGGPGSFDFMSVDNKDRLALACHPGTSSFAVINLDSDVVKTVDATTKANGIAADSNGKKVYAAGPGNTLVQFDMNTWTKTGSLPLDGPGDTVLYDAKNSVVYVDNDDGTNLWVVDPSTMKIVTTVKIKEAPEVMVLDPKRGKIYQNIKTSNTLQVIDVNTRTVVGEYTLGEVQSPHGLAEDRKDGKLFAVGKNGKLAILDVETGKLLASVDVTKGSDQIAYDSKLKRLYVPGSGVMQTVQITSDGATVIGSEPLPAGCHSVAVDPTTHNVWVVYTDKEKSYAMKYVSSAKE